MMSGHLPKAVLEGLQDAQSRPENTARLTLRAGDFVVPVIEMTDRGLTVARDKKLPLRGHVDIYKGTELVRRALIIAAALEPGRAVFEFKQQSACGATAPLDFVHGQEIEGYLPALD